MCQMLSEPGRVRRDALSIQLLIGELPNTGRDGSIVNFASTPFLNFSTESAQFTHRDLVIQAEAYRAEHRADLISEAAAMVEQWRRNGFFEPREDKLGGRGPRSLRANARRRSRSNR